MPRGQLSSLVSRVQFNQLIFRDSCYRDCVTRYFNLIFFHKLSPSGLISGIIWRFPFLTDICRVSQPPGRKIAGLANTGESGLTVVGYTDQSGLISVGHTGESRLTGVALIGQSTKKIFLLKYRHCWLRLKILIDRCSLHRLVISPQGLPKLFEE